MNSSFTLDAAAPVSFAGLSLDDILRDLPTDPGAIVALILCVGFITLVLYFGTRSGTPPESSDSERTDPPTEDPKEEEAGIP